MFVYDVTNLSSFKALEGLFNYIQESYMEQLKIQKSLKMLIPTILMVGNKIDLEE